MIPLEEVADKILKTSRYDTEVNIVSHDSMSIIYDRFSIPSRVESASLHVRVTKGKKYGYSLTTDLKKWKQSIKDAAKIMRVTKPLDIKPELPLKQNYRTFAPNKEILSIGYEKLSDLFSRMFDIKPKVIGASISKVVDEGIIANSNEVYNKHKFALLSASVEAKYKRASAFGVKIDKKPFDTEIASSEAEKFCLKSVNPKQIKPMVVDVVLDYFALSSLIGSVMLPSFYADRVQKHESFLSDKLGQGVFSPKLTIFDDGIKGLLSGPCDNEGVRMQRKTLIRKGVVSNFLYDAYSAQREGKKSTGNCSSLAKRPSIGCTNVTIAPGKKEVNSSDCLFVRSLSGVHTSNPVSGDFSVNIDNAFYRGRAVKHGMIGGNIFELFNKIDSIGSKPRQEDIVKTPVIKFKDVQIIA